MLGLILGGLGPGVASLTMGGMWVLFVLASELVGVGGGVLMGIIDPPRRLVKPGARGGKLVSGLVLTGLAVLPLAVGWTAIAGAVAALCTFMLPGLLGSVGHMDWEAIPLFAVLGAAMGVLAGTPGVVVFGMVRAGGIATEGRIWPVAAGLFAAGLVTAILSLPAFMLVVGAVAGTSNF